MKRIIISLFALLLVLAACSASETDFKQVAEEAAVEAAERDNPDFTATASCQEPGSTDVGTTFSCTVTFDDGDTLPMTAVIREGDVVEVSGDS